ncbi:MAG: CDP-diacylglycerol--glycerol-3-phosphate 3-phosphatidyltransferase [Bryobacteraceae bacterium]|jgi:cardiolipin synthase
MPTWLTLPNLFTLARVVLTPFILQAILNQRHVAALALFAAAAATDGIDGYLARRLRAATPAGAFLDPIADKLLLSGVYLALAITGSVPWWLVVVIFGRDLLILSSSSVALLVTQLRAFPPSVWGKASTAVQILTAVAFLARNAAPTSLLATLSAALVWPTAALTVWSGVHYAWRGVRLVRMH